MTSLTTLFVVGPEEYVEFNESMGSKAFVEHIWDQSRTPLKVEDTSASGTQLHSAGARISIAPPPRIEFPTVLRQKGRGNKYKLSGRYISWEELKRRNPIALKDPPSLEEFINKGSQIGTAERLEPGAFLKGEKKFKLNKKQKGTIEVHESQDGWIGGSSESVYAPKSIASGSSESMYAPKPSEGGSSESIYATKTLSTNGGTSDSIYAPKTTNLPMDNNVLLQEPKATSESSSNELPRTIRKSRSGLSLWARLGMEASIDDVEKQKDAASSSSDDSTKKHSKIQQRPGKLTLPDNRLSHLTGSNDPEAKTPIAQTPLSATHTPPETPLKRHGNRDRIEIPPTPNTQERFAQAESSVSAKGGLMLDPGQSQAITPTISEPPSLPLAESTPARKTAPIRAARNQMDEMLARLRQARSGLSGGDSSESIWAPKKKQEESSTSNCSTPKAYETTPQIPLSDKIIEKEKNIIKKDEAEDKSNIQKPGDPPAKVSTKPEPVSTLTKDSNSGGKSLFDRLGPKFEVKESKPAAKKERKRGGRNHTHEDNELSSGKEVFENAPSSSSSGMKETKFDNDSKKISKPEPEKLVEPVKASNELQTITNSLADESNEKTKKTSAESKEVEKLDVVQKADEISSPQKVESVSQIGNDTFTSFDWADDDDESLPELTEEWMKVALLSSPSKTEQAKSIVVGESEIGESVKAESTVDNNTSSNASKRERKGRAGKREKDRGVDERNANSRKSEKTNSVNQGIRIAGTANSNQTTNDAKNLSAVPPWQRRSMATSPPKEPLGLRIAGRASEIQPKSDKFQEKVTSQSSKFKKNITPSSSSSSSFNPPPSNKGRGFVGSVMPPNATPLHAEGHPFLAKSESNTSIKPDNSSDSHSQNGRSRARGGRSNRRGSHGTDS